MKGKRTSRSNRIDWLAQGPLAPHNAYKKYLTACGYAVSTFRNSVRSIAHFAQWIHGQHLRLR